LHKREQIEVRKSRATEINNYSVGSDRELLALILESLNSVDETLDEISNILIEIRDRPSEATLVQSPDLSEGTMKSESLIKRILKTGGWK